MTLRTMHEQPLLGLTGIVVLGISAQWIAWRLGIPAILLLLAFGLAVGPGLGALEPDKLLGPLLLPWVSLSVSVVLFEGGLSLKFGELRGVAGVLLRLTTVGLLVTWIVGTLAARIILEFDWSIAAMLAAVLVVTGPTVIAPILRHLRLGGQVGSVLKWEGIVIDPAGVVLAVTVFAAIRSTNVGEAAGHTLSTLGMTILVGYGLGLVGAAALIVPLRRFWIPDSLQSVTSLTAGLGIFALANSLQAEAGLLAVTIMGIILANQRFVAVRHLVEFKENLTVLLVSCLFIVLAARLKRADLAEMDWRSVAFLGVLIFVARPASVLISTIRSTLNWRERFFLCMMAPRGIVAAAVMSVFALELAAMGLPGANQLVPITFLVIIGTVTFYGLAATPLAHRLKLAHPNPQGILFVGAHPWARALAEALVAEEVPVMLVDSDWSNTSAARQAGLATYFGSILSEQARAELDYANLGYLAALTANEEVNSLACLRFMEVFGRGKVYQLPFDATLSARREAVPLDLRGRLLFGQDLTYTNLVERFGEHPSLRSTPLTPEFDYPSFLEMHGDAALPLVVIDATGRVSLFTATDPPKPQAGSTLISAIALTNPQPVKNEDDSAA